MARKRTHLKDWRKTQKRRAVRRAAKLGAAAVVLGRDLGRFFWGSGANTREIVERGDRDVE